MLKKRYIKVYEEQQELKSRMLQIIFLEYHNIKKTIETYLPLIVSQNFGAIQQYLSHSQALAENVGISYVINVLGVGAAMSALEIVSNYPND